MEVDAQSRQITWQGFYAICLTWSLCRQPQESVNSALSFVVEDGTEMTSQERHVQDTSY